MACRTGKCFRAGAGLQQSQLRSVVVSKEAEKGNETSFIILSRSELLLNVCSSVDVEGFSLLKVVM